MWRRTPPRGARWARVGGSSEDFQLMSGLNAVCFRDLMSGEKRRRRLSRIGSLRSQKWSSGDSCDFDMLGSLDLSDGGDSTTSSSSTASSILKDWNGLRNEGVKSSGGGLLCGLMLQKRIHFCPSDNNLQFWAESLEGEVGPCEQLDDRPSTFPPKCCKRSTDEIAVDFKKEMGGY